MRRITQFLSFKTQSWRAILQQGIHVWNPVMTVLACSIPRVPGLDPETEARERIVHLAEALKEGCVDDLVVAGLLPAGILGHG